MEPNLYLQLKSTYKIKRRSHLRTLKCKEMRQRREVRNRISNLCSNKLPRFDLKTSPSRGTVCDSAWSRNSSRNSDSLTKIIWERGLCSPQSMWGVLVFFSFFSCFFALRMGPSHGGVLSPIRMQTDKTLSKTPFLWAEDQERLLYDLDHKEECWRGKTQKKEFSNSVCKPTQGSDLTLRYECTRETQSIMGKTLRTEL